MKAPSLGKELSRNTPVTARPLIALSSPSCPLHPKNGNQEKKQQHSSCLTAVNLSAQSCCQFPSFCPYRRHVPLGGGDPLPSDFFEHVQSDNLEANFKSYRKEIWQLLILYFFSLIWILRVACQWAKIFARVPPSGQFDSILASECFSIWAA